jgi:hypothetical protein
MVDLLNKYVTNPVYKLGSFFTRSASTQSEKIVETIVRHEYEKLEPFGYKQLPRISKLFLRTAACSGVLAVVMSAYGSLCKW